MLLAFSADALLKVIARLDLVDHGDGIVGIADDRFTSIGQGQLFASQDVRPGALAQCPEVSGGANVGPFDVAAFAKLAQCLGHGGCERLKGVGEVRSVGDGQGVLGADIERTCTAYDEQANIGAEEAVAEILVLGFVQGAGIGFGIPVAQRFGAGDKEGFLRYLWNGAWVCALVSLVLTLATVFATRPLLVAMGTPKELFDMAASYIGVVFAGIPATLFYNYTASVLRAVGDSRRPFIFLMVSCAVNVASDLFFILVCGLGVVGSALGNVIGTVLSVVLNCWLAFSRVPQIRFDQSAAAWSTKHAQDLCAVGLPMGFEYSVSALGALAMQGAINALGPAAVTAQTAGEKIRQLFTMPMESVGMAIASYVGQNYGAGRFDRMRQGILSAAAIQLLYCAACWVVIFVFKEQLIGFVLGEEVDADIVSGAVDYLFFVSCFFMLHGLLMVFRNTLQGMGHSVQAVASGVSEFAGRAAGSLAAVGGMGFAGICLANPLAWGCALVYCLVMVGRLLAGKNGKKKGRLWGDCAKG